MLLLKNECTILCIIYYALFPTDYSETRRQDLQEKLLTVILRLLSEHPDLHYYQGFHDIVITFLLVGGEDFAYAIVNVLVQHHIRCVYSAGRGRPC